MTQRMLLSLKMNFIHFQYSEEKQLHLKTQCFFINTLSYLSCFKEGRPLELSHCSDYFPDKVWFQLRFRRSGIASLVIHSWRELRSHVCMQLWFTSSFPFITHKSSCSEMIFLSIVKWGFLGMNELYERKFSVYSSHTLRKGILHLILLRIWNLSLLTCLCYAALPSLKEDCDFASRHG